MAGLKVLLFESDPVFGGALESAFTALGCEARRTDDGQAGIDLAQSWFPDLIILAIELPRTNGFAVCNRLKKHPELVNIPLVITSSEAPHETFEQHSKLRTHAQDYLHKPIEVADLLDRCRRLVALPDNAPEELDGAALEAVEDVSIRPTSPPPGTEGLDVSIPQAPATGVGNTGNDALDAAFDNIILDDDNKPHVDVSQRAVPAIPPEPEPAAPTPVPAPPARGLYDDESESATMIVDASRFAGVLANLKIPLGNEPAPPPAAPAPPAPPIPSTPPTPIAKAPSIPAVPSVAPSATPPPMTPPSTPPFAAPPVVPRAGSVLVPQAPRPGNSATGSSPPMGLPKFNTGAPASVTPPPVTSSVASSPPPATRSSPPAPAVIPAPVSVAPPVAPPSVVPRAVSKPPEPAGPDPEIERLSKRVQELESSLAQAQQQARERDELLSENARLRREIEEVPRLQRELEDTRARAAKGGGVSTREFLELRESLHRKDKELLKLKDEGNARERALLEARERAASLEHEKNDLDERLLSRERVLAELEEQQATRERSSEEEIAKAKEALTALQKTHEETLSQLRASHESALSEVRTQSEATLAQARSEFEQTLSQTNESSLRALREKEEELQTAQQEALTRLQREHSEALQAERERAAKEQEEQRGSLETAAAAAAAAAAALLAEVRAEKEQLSTQLEAERSQHSQTRTEAAAALSAREQALQEEHAKALAALQTEHSQALEGAQEKANEQLESVRSALQSELEEVRSRSSAMEKTLAQAEQHRDRFANELSEALRKTERATQRHEQDLAVIEKARRALALANAFLEQTEGVEQASEQDPQAG